MAGSGSTFIYPEKRVDGLRERQKCVGLKFINMFDRVKNKSVTEIRSFGKALSRMVMPNIGAFIAWGLITALFIPAGWIPDERLARMVDPLLRYLLPLLIAFTGGKNVGGERGGIMAAIATMGVIVGSDIPMFLGAMIMGPFAGWLIKKVDRLLENKIPAGFEMLVNNFSIGILGMGCALFGFFAIGPVVTLLTGFLSSAVALVMDKGILPLVSLFIEPGKILFLNNAINHGILTPLGIEQVKENGLSIMFLLEANPGTGLGVLAASWLFAKGTMKQTAPGAIIIHFFGGIHEIYFPYILARPVLIAAPILGSASAIALLSLFDGGIAAPASPGSIIAVMAMAPRGQHLTVLLAVFVAALVSFLVAAPLIRKQQGKETTIPLPNTPEPSNINKNDVSRIVFACDAGMGSSALGATRFRKRLSKLGVHIPVDHCPVDEIPADADLVVCQAIFGQRAARSAPGAELVLINDFLESPALDELVDRLAHATAPVETPVDDNTQAPSGIPGEGILCPDNILTGLAGHSREEAIALADRILEKGGYVLPGYDRFMLEREKSTSTYIGLGIAIPHGTQEAMSRIIRTGLVVLQYPQGIRFGEEMAFLVIGIAAKGDEHLEVLSAVATALDNPDLLEELYTTTDKQRIYSALSSAINNN